MIFGAGGMAGHMINQYLRETNKYTLYPIYHMPRSTEDISCNVVDLQSVKTLIEEIHPQIIINAIGVLNDRSEQDKSLTSYINTFFPKYLEWIGTKENIKIIHISTDCVFSGRKGLYTECDEKDAKSMYGLSKNFGEIINGKDLTIRTSIIGPELKEGKGLFHWLMKQTGQVKGYNQVYWGGVTTLELAKAIEDAIEKNISGLFHLTNDQRISKFDLLALIIRHFELKAIQLVEDETNKGDKSLKHIKSGWTFEVAGYEEMMRELRGWMLNHSDLYEQYKR